MINKQYHQSLFAKLFTITLSVSLVQAEMAPAKLIPFDTFIQSVKHADASDFLARPDSKVKDAAAFQEMRDYILSMYHDVHVKHSYLLGPQTFDCVPVNEQPSVRALGAQKSVAEPPATTRSQTPEPTTSDQSSSGGHCEDQTMPMRRITLEQLSRFTTLSQFLKKAPNPTVGPPVSTGH